MQGWYNDTSFQSCVQSALVAGSGKVPQWWEMEDGFDIVKTDSSNESLLIHVDSYFCIDGLNFEIFCFVSICINFY